MEAAGSLLRGGSDSRGLCPCRLPRTVVAYCAAARTPLFLGGLPNPFTA